MSHTPTDPYGSAGALHDLHESMDSPSENPTANFELVIQSTQDAAASTTSILTEGSWHFTSSSALHQHQYQNPTLTTRSLTKQWLCRVFRRISLQMPHSERMRHSMNPNRTIKLHHC